METLKFKTNIMCGSCLAKVTPLLNEQVGKDNWQVDLQSLERILTVNTDKSTVEVIDTVQEAGFKADLK
jgi:copper chaperone CopZ